MGRSRSKRTLVPPYHRVDAAPTDAPFDPGAYVRIVEGRMSAAADVGDSRETIPVPEPAASSEDLSRAPTEVPSAVGLEELARAMYASYLASEFPEALTLAEHVVAKAPDHALAQAVVARCRAVMGGPGPSLSPSSVLRLRDDATPVESLRVAADSILVLHHLDGVTDAATVADLVGMSPVEALEHLHALLEAGVVELVA